jgi:hypothetical protein
MFYAVRGYCDEADFLKNPNDYTLKDCAYAFAQYEILSHSGHNIFPQFIDYNNENRFCIGVYTNELPKRNIFIRAWSSVKNAFK